MFEHYLHITWRHLNRHWQQVFLSLASLVIGLTAALLVTLYLIDEYRYDDFHPAVDRSYRVQQRFIDMDDALVALTSARVAPTLNAALGEDGKAVRQLRRKSVLRAGDVELTVDDLSYVDPGFSQLFRIEARAGDLAATLAEPDRLALSESLARRLFGSEAAVGKTLMVDGRIAMRIGAVFSDLPGNTHLKFSALSSTASWAANFGRDALDSWTQNTSWTYVQLAEGVSAERLNNVLVQSVAGPLKAHLPGVRIRLESLPVRDIHLHSQAIGEQAVNGDLRQVRVFALVALVILAVSLFNYVNMATARAATRDREVGVRLVLGATRSDLGLQFMAEPLLLTALAFVLALAATGLLLPGFNAMFGKQLGLSLLVEHLPLALAIYFGTALAAGFYPAFLLSRIRPLLALKGLSSRGRSGARFRQSVLLLQLAAGLCLLIWGGHTWLQLRHLTTLPTGYEREGRLLITDLDTETLNRHFAALRQSLKSDDTIVAIAGGELMPTQGLNNFLSARASDAPDRVLDQLGFTNILPGYFQGLGISLLAGRDFSEADVQNARPWGDDGLNRQGPPVILNRMASEALGFGTPEQAIGQSLDLAFDSEFSQPVRARVIAVVEDYLQGSAHDPRRPMVFTTGMPYAAYSQLVVHYRNGEFLSAASRLKERWQALTGQDLGRYQRLSDAYIRLHRQDQERGVLLNLFALLALACLSLGLIGMCASMCQRRLREMAIRKILGASWSQLAWLVSREFLVLAGLSALIAWPLAWLSVSGWLRGFSEHIGQAYWLYFLATLAVLLLTLLVTVAVGRRLDRVDLLLLLKEE